MKKIVLFLILSYGIQLLGSDSKTFSRLYCLPEPTSTSASPELERLFRTIPVEEQPHNTLTNFFKNSTEPREMMRKILKKFLRAENLTPEEQKLLVILKEHDHKSN